MYRYHRLEDAALASERCAEYLIEMKDYDGAVLRLKEGIERYRDWDAEKKSGAITNDVLQEMQVPPLMNPYYTITWMNKCAWLALRLFCLPCSIAANCVAGHRQTGAVLVMDLIARTIGIAGDCIHHWNTIFDQRISIVLFVPKGHRSSYYL